MLEFCKAYIGLDSEHIRWSSHKIIADLFIDMENIPRIQNLMSYLMNVQVACIFLN